MDEKDNCKQRIHGKSKNQLIFRTCICLFILLALIITSYFSIVYLKFLVKTQDDVLNRMHKLETEHLETFDIILKVVASVNNVTGALQEFENYFIPRRLFKNTRSQLPLPNRKERRRRAEESDLKETEESEVEEGLQRTIHSFRREMFSLNDRYVLQVYPEFLFQILVQSP